MSKLYVPRISRKCLFLMGLSILFFMVVGEARSQADDPPAEAKPPVVERINMGSFFNSFTENLLLTFDVSSESGIKHLELDIVAHSDAFMAATSNVTDPDVKATGDFFVFQQNLEPLGIDDKKISILEPIVLPEGVLDNEGIPSDAYLRVRVKAVDTVGLESPVVEKIIHQDLGDIFKGISVVKYYNADEDEEYVIGSVLLNEVDRVKDFSMTIVGVSQKILNEKGGVWDHVQREAFVYQTLTFPIKDDQYQYQLYYSLDENYDIPKDAILNVSVIIYDMAGNSVFTQFTEFLSNSIEENLEYIWIEPSDLFMTGFAQSTQLRVKGMFSESGELDITEAFTGTSYFIDQDPDTPVISITQNGKVTAYVNGTAQITAVNRGKMDTITVTVNYDKGLEAIQIGPEDLVVPYLGATEKLTLKGYIRDDQNELIEIDLTYADINAKYSSSDRSVVDTTIDGSVYSKMVGEATITAELQGQVDTLLVKAIDGPPKVEIIPSKKQIPEGETFTITADAWDDLGVTLVEFFIDGFPVAEDTAEPFELILQAPERRAGTKMAIGVKVTDTIGQVTTVDNFLVDILAPKRSPLPKTFTVLTDAYINGLTEDDLPPQLGIIFPTPGERMLTSLDWRFRITGNDKVIKKVEFFVNGQILGTLYSAMTMPIKPPQEGGGGGQGQQQESVMIPIWEMVYRPTDIDPGSSVVFTARVFDADGNYSSSEAVIFRAEQDLPPVVRLLTPVDGDDVIENTDMTISGRISDDTLKLGTTAQFLINDKIVFETTKKDEFQMELLFDPNKFSGVWNVAYKYHVPEGNIFTKLRVRLVAIDAFNQLVSSEENDVIIIANMPPEVMVSNPLPGSEITTGDEVLIRAIAIDDSGIISRVEFFIDGELLGTDETATYNIYGMPEYEVEYFVPLEKVEQLITITARATDGTGKKTLSTETVVAIVADHTLPTIHIASPRNDEIFRQTQNVLVSIAGFDDIGVKAASITISKENDNEAQPIHFETEHVVIVNKLQNTFFVNYVISKDYLNTGDRIKIEASATDNSNNVNFAVPLRFDVVEDLPPEVTIIRPYPHQNIVMDSDIKVSADVVDDVGLNRVELLDNDGNVIDTDFLQPFQFDHYIGTFAQERYITLRVRAYDSALQQAESAVTIKATFDTEPPLVSVLEPYGESFVPCARSIKIIAGTSDNVEVDRVKFILTFADNDTYETVVNSGTLDSAGIFTHFSTNYTFPLEDAGTEVKIEAIAYDTSNNVGSNKVSVKLVADLPPMIGINYPSAGATYYEGEELTMKFTVNDDYGVQLVRSISDNTIWDEKSLPIATDWKEIYKKLKIEVPTKLELKVQVPQVPLAFNQAGQAIDVAAPLTVEAVDAFGNVGSTSVTLNVKNDIKPPTAQITSPKASVQLLEGNRLNFTVDTTDDIAIKGVRFYRNGEYDGETKNITSTRVDVLKIPNPLSYGFLIVSTTTYSIFTYSTSIPPGSTNTTLQYYAVAYDRASNNSENSNIIKVEVIPDKVPPRVSIAFPKYDDAIVENTEFYITLDVSDNVTSAQNMSCSVKVEFDNDTDVYITEYDNEAKKQKVMLTAPDHNVYRKRMKIWAYATDEAGNRGESERRKIWIMEDAYPAIAIDEPEDGDDVVEQLSYDIKLTVKDDVGARHSTVLRTGGEVLTSDITSNTFDSLGGVSANTFAFKYDTFPATVPVSGLKIEGFDPVHGLIGELNLNYDNDSVVNLVFSDTGLGLIEDNVLKFTFIPAEGVTISEITAHVDYDSEDIAPQTYSITGDPLELEITVPMDAVSFKMTLEAFNDSAQQVQMITHEIKLLSTSAPMPGPIPEINYALGLMMPDDQNIHLYNYNDQLIPAEGKTKDPTQKYEEKFEYNDIYIPLDSAPYSERIVGTTVDTISQRTLSNMVTINYIPDTVPPKVSITNYADGQKIVGGYYIRLKYEASDNVGVDRCLIFVDGSQVQSITYPTKEAIIKIPESKIGQTMIFQIRAIDLVGNIGKSKDVVLAVIPDNPPVVNITSVKNILCGFLNDPHNQQAIGGIRVLEGTGIDTGAKITDEAGLAKIQVFINGEELHSGDLPKTYEIPEIYFAQTVSMTQIATYATPFGSNTFPFNIRVVATDVKGQQGADELTVISVSDTAPYVSMASPIHTQKIVQGKFSINFEVVAADNLSLAWARFYINGQPMAFLDRPEEIRIAKYGLITSPIAPYVYDEFGRPVPFDPQVKESVFSFPSPYDNVDPNNPRRPKLYKQEVYFPVGLTENAVSIKIGAEVSDKEGNVTYVEQDLEVVPDLGVPECSFYRPILDWDAIEGTTITVGVNGRDNARISKVEVWAGVGVNKDTGEVDWLNNGLGKRIYFKDGFPIQDFIVGSWYSVDMPPQEFLFQVPFLSELGITGVNRRPFNEFVGGTKEEYLLATRVWDHSGNEATAWLPIDIIPDNNPIIDISAPRYGTKVVEGSDVTIVTEAADDVGVRYVDLEVNGEIVKVLRQAPFTFTYNVPKGTAGTDLLINVRAVDTFTENDGNVSRDVPIVLHVTGDDPPSIGIAYPFEDDTVYEGRYLLVQCAAIDDVAVVSVKFYINGNLIETDLNHPFEIFWRIPYGSAGETLHLEALATDTAGQQTWAREVFVRVIKDDQPPVISIEEPANFSQVIEGTEVKVRALANDNVEVSAVRFFVDDEQIYTDLVPPYECMYGIPQDSAFDYSDPLNPKPNVFTLKATAIDTASNKSSDEVQIGIVQDLPPVVSLVGPKNGDSVVEGQSILVSAVGDDDIDIKTATLKAQEEQNGEFLDQGTDFVLPFQWYFHVPYGTRGQQRKLKVVVEDTALQQATSTTITINITEDKAPTCELRRPLDGAVVFDGQEVMIEASARDDVEVFKVEFYVNDKLHDTRYTNLADEGVFDGGDVYRGKFDAPLGAANSLFKVHAIAYDNRGQFTKSNERIIGTLRDTTAPNVSLWYPADRSVVTEGTIAKVRANSVDLGGTDSVTFYVDGIEKYTDYVPEPQQKHAPWLYEYLVPFGKPGDDITLTCKAVDPSGNVGFSRPISIEVGISARSAIQGERCVEVEDNTVYVTHYVPYKGWELRIYDIISAPENPVLFSKLELGNITPHSIHVSKQGYAYITATGFSGFSNNAYLYIIDVRNPFFQVYQSRIELPLDQCNDVTVTDDLALVATGLAGLQAVNIHNPYEPLNVGYRVTPGTAYGIDVSGNYVYMATGYEGLSVIDLSNPNLFEIGSIDTFGLANRVKVVGNLAYVAGEAAYLLATPDAGLTIIDISNPANPEVISRLDLAPEREDHLSGGTFGIEVVGTLAFLTTETVDQEGKLVDTLMNVIDISDPTQPERIANGRIPNKGRDLRALGEYMVVSSTSSTYVFQIPYTNVIAVSPGVDEENVAVNTSIKITFNDQINPDSVVDPQTGASLGHITLRDVTHVSGPDAEGTLIEGEFTFDGPDIIFTPLQALSVQTEYEIHVTTDLVDLAGFQYLITPFTSRFTTLRSENAVMPSIVRAVPSYGPMAGGHRITIEGDFFVDGATVMIGGFPATEVEVSENGKYIACTTPTNNYGPAAVTVTNPGGLYDTLMGAYLYTVPLEISFLVPAVGSLSGKNWIEIIGFGFAPGATVKIDGRDCTEVVVESTRRIRCRTPEGEFGPADVVVTNTDGTSAVLLEGFLYTRLIVNQMLENYDSDLITFWPEKQGGYIDPTSIDWDPTEISPGISEGIDIYGDYAYICVRSRIIRPGPNYLETQLRSVASTLSIVNIEDPDNAYPIGGIDLPVWLLPKDVAVTQSFDAFSQTMRLYAYVIANSTPVNELDSGYPELVLVDVTEPTAPFVVFDPSAPSGTSTGRIDFDGSAIGIDAKDSFAVIASGTGGLQFVDGSDKYNPAVVSTLKSVVVDGQTVTINARSVMIHENKAYVTASAGTKGMQLLIIDIESPAFPVKGNVKLAGNGNCPLVIDRNIAYNAGGFNIDFEAIDIRNPLLPKVISSLDPNLFGNNTQLNYQTNITGAGVDDENAVDEFLSKLLGYSTQQFANGVAVVGNLACVTTAKFDPDNPPPPPEWPQMLDSYLEVIDISNPKTPRLIDAMDFMPALFPRSIEVGDDFCIVSLEEKKHPSPFIVTDVPEGVVIVGLPIMNVVETSPKPGAVAVPVDSKVTVRFSEPVIWNKVTGTSLDGKFILSELTGSAVSDILVPGHVEIEDNNGNGIFITYANQDDYPEMKHTHPELLGHPELVVGYTFSYVPDQLETGKTYIVKITTGVKSAFTDVPVVGPYEMNFTTASSTNSIKPVVLEVSPDSGPTSGNTVITIKGYDFQQGASVFVGGIPATEETVSADGKTLTCKSPPHFAGPAAIKVVNPGSAYDIKFGVFAYVEALRVFSCTPDYGPTMGGTKVTIAGKGFSPSSDVKVYFGLAEATSVRVISFQKIVATTPDGLIGYVDVKVVNPDGTFDVLPEGFRYIKNLGASFNLSAKPVDLKIEQIWAFVLTQAGYEVHNLDITEIDPDKRFNLNRKIGGMNLGVGRGMVLVPKRDLVIVSYQPQEFAQAETYYHTEASTMGKVSIINSEIPSMPFIISTQVEVGNVVGEIAIRGNLIFAAAGDDGVIVIDIASLQNPFIVDWIQTDEPAFGIALEGDTAVVLTGDQDWDTLSVTPGSGKTYFLNVGRPDFPIITSMNITARKVNIKDKRVYLARENAGVTVVDILDAQNPRLIGTWTGPRPAYDVAMEGDLALTAYDTYSIGMVDISTLDNDGTVTLMGYTQDAGKGSTIAVESKLGYIYAIARSGQKGYLYMLTNPVHGVHSFWPDNGETVPIEWEEIRVNFNQEIKANLVNSSTFQINNLTTGQQLMPQGPGDYIAIGNTMAFYTNGRLEAGCDYEIRVKKELQDEFGQVLFNDWVSYFKTATIPNAEPPEVVEVLPHIGPVEGGTPITITGNNFVQGMKLYVGDVEATNLDVENKRLCRAVTPGGDPGPASVRVWVPGDMEASLSGGFLYAIPPTLDRIIPFWGNPQGGTSIKIFGTGFVPGTTVSPGSVISIAGVDVYNQHLISVKKITATAPPGPFGPQDVMITNPGFGGPGFDRYVLKNG
ncbi:MAG: hypothetical protein C4541_10100, partial [Candidatus Auribacter fodinae]